MLEPAAASLRLTLAAEFPKAEIVGADISEDALSCSPAKNAERVGLVDRVRFLRSNLLENVQPNFDVIGRESSVRFDRRPAEIFLAKCCTNPKWLFSQARAGMSWCGN